MLTSEELQTLLATVWPEFSDAYPLVLFLADTGARLGEASALRWIDLDLERGTVCFEDFFLVSDGKLEVLERVRRQRSRSELPIILATALDDSDDAVEGLDGRLRQLSRRRQPRREA